MEEIWKDIKNYEGYYQVSNLGNVRSLDRKVKYTNSKTNEKYDRVLKGGVLKAKLTGKKYNFVRLCKNNKIKCKQVHRLVAETFIPNDKNKKTVNHKNGIKTDNRVCNLEWNTSKENCNHAIQTGLISKNKSKGEKNSQSILTKEEVLNIREKSKKGLSPQEILYFYNKVKICTIKDILAKRSWKHI